MPEELDQYLSESTQESTQDDTELFGQEYSNPELDQHLSEEQDTSEQENDFGNDDQDDQDDSDDSDDSENDYNFNEINSNDEEDLYSISNKDHSKYTNAIVNRLTKKGVNISNLADNVGGFYDALNNYVGGGLRISSGNDSTHMKGSKHYSNKSIDIGANSSDNAAYSRLKNIFNNSAALKQFKQHYNIEDIIDEGDHYHIESVQTGGNIYSQTGNPFKNATDGYYPTIQPIEPRLTPIMLNTNMDANLSSYLNRNNNQIKELDKGPTNIPKADMTAGVDEGTKMGMDLYNNIFKVKGKMIGNLDNALTGVSALLSEKDNNRKFQEYLKNMYKDSERNYYS